MLVQPFLRRLVVIRRDREESIGAGLGELARQHDDFLGVVAAGPGEDWHLAAGLLGEDLDDAPALGRGQRRVLAGRAARRQEVDAAVDLAAAHAPNRGFVKIATPREWRYECRAGPGKWRSHGVSLHS